MSLVKEFEPRFLLRQKIMIVLAVVVVLIILVEIWAVNRLSTYGVQINQLEKLMSVLTLQNQLLENEIAKKEALVTVEDYAHKVGFEQVKNIQYLSGSDLAFNH